jgi:Prealbumin-like fold domain
VPVSTKFMKSVGALAATTLVAVFSGVAPAGAATTGTLTVTTNVQNAGPGIAGPDSFVYHVILDADGTEAASGIWNANGKTAIQLPPGTYSVYEDPLAPYEEKVGHCASITITAGQAATCTVTNVWLFASILVTTTVDNAGGGTANPGAFHYRVLDANDNSEVKTGTFNTSGTTRVQLPDGTYTIVEDPLDGYTEDFSGCAGLIIDYQNPGACIIANKFKPSTSTTGPPTTLPSGTQVTIHGSATSTTSCLTTLVPPLQAPTQTPITLTVATDAFAQPHKGDPISLSNTTAAISIPGTLVAQGVQLGFVHVGDTIPANVTFQLAGDGTKQQTHTYQFHIAPKITSAGGHIQPLVTKVSLPDTTWTPNNATDPVFFVEKKLTIASTINLGSAVGTVTNTFACEPGATVVALSAQGSQPPTGGPSTSAPGGGGGVVGAAGSGVLSGTGSGTLPRTGTNVWAWLAPAVLLISAGLLVLGATGRKRRRTL